MTQILTTELSTDRAYIVLSLDDWQDVAGVCQERGLDVEYSIESDGAHVWSHIEEIEAILWAASVIDGLEMVFSEIQ